MNEAETASGLAPTPGYRYAKRTGRELHVSGQVPADSSGEIVGRLDPHHQARQCLTNLETVLSCHGFFKEDIQQLTIYVVGDRGDLTSAWRAVREAFPEGVPPATLLGVALLGYEHQLVEIDARVVKKAPLKRP